jgi:hypothetical protein
LQCFLPTVPSNRTRFPQTFVWHQCRIAWAFRGCGCITLGWNWWHRRRPLTLHLVGGSQSCRPAPRCMPRVLLERRWHWWDRKRLSHHVPHQSQVNTQSSRLLPRLPNLLENPLTFFTNTRHLLQCYHLSFSTKKDCIFSRNTVVNIDVAPRLPVRHIITESE